MRNQIIFLKIDINTNIRKFHSEWLCLSAMTIQHQQSSE